MLAAPRTFAAAAVLLGMVLGCEGVIHDPNADRGGPGTPRGPGGDVLQAQDIAPTGARRLTRSEIDNTLDVLLGDNRRVGTMFLPEDNTERDGLFLNWPFDNAYPLQEADKVLVGAFETVADDVAASAASDETTIADLLPCTPTGADDAVCFRSFIEEFGRRVFRRPMDADEVDNFMRLHDLAIEADDFNFGIEIVIRAMLQTPDFIYRVELGEAHPSLEGVFNLTEYEIATRMSFLLWGSAPEGWLLDLADEGMLSDPESRRAIAQDMLEDPRALDQVDRFHAMWLGYLALPHDAETAVAMREETRATLQRVIFDERRPYLDIFRLDETFITPDLAESYGLDAPASGADWVSYGDTGRAGILSHGTVLSAFAQVGDTSPTKRGIFVRERLLCQTLQPPPPSVNADEPPEVDCRSEFVEVHQNGACGGCHSLMDPVGWGLENYDMYGRYREHDDGKPECAIDGEGELVGVGTFSGPAELSQLVLDDGTLEACTIRQVVRFAMGREERSDDERFIAALLEEHAGSDWTLLDLLADLVASDHFVLMRRDSGEEL